MRRIYDPMEVISRETNKKNGQERRKKALIDKDIKKLKELSKGINNL